MLQTVYMHLHLTTIITAREFYSPSCNLQLMQLMFDFGDWFTVKFVDSAVLPLGQTIISNISSQSHFETKWILFSFFSTFIRHTAQVFNDAGVTYGHMFLKAQQPHYAL